MRIVFIGTGDIGVPTLRMLQQSPDHELVGVVTQPNKPAGRAQRITPPPIKVALGEASVPILQPERIKTADAISSIGQLTPDVLVVMAYGQILPLTVLQLAKVACLNLHASLLPRWRGAAPIQAAIAAGDFETGITVVYMDEGLDTGDILLQSKIEIVADETGGSLQDRLAQIAPTALASALSSLGKGNAPRIPQENALVTYAPKLQREHGRIDWNESAEALERKIRAFDPWPAAFMNIWDERHGRQRTLKIFRAAVITDIDRIPGTIIRTPQGALVFATRDGALALHEVQLEGSRRMTAKEFFRGHPWIGRML